MDVGLIWLSHYLLIARDGCYRFEHGFFPLYPIIIRTLYKNYRFSYLLSALLITYSSFLLFLYILNKLFLFDFQKRRYRPNRTLANYASGQFLFIGGIQRFNLFIFGSDLFLYGQKTKMVVCRNCRRLGC